MVYRPNTPTMSQKFNSIGNTNKVSTTVGLSTLPDEIARAGIDIVSLLKIDAEGAEIHILEGALPAVKAKLVKRIVMVCCENCAPLLALNVHRICACSWPRSDRQAAARSASLLVASVRSSSAPDHPLYRCEPCRSFSPGAHRTTLCCCGRS